MSERVTMPALGESVTEGTVTRWLKSVGDSVAVDEPLLEVSTDKVDTEIPSPVAGTLQEILVQEDETVPVGADLAVIGDGPVAAVAPAQEAPAEEPAAQEEPAVEPEAPSTEAPVEPEAPSTEAPVAPETSEPEAAAAPAAPSGGGGEVSGGETVTMPALGESVTEGTVTRWLKAEGEEVAVDEPLLEVSTDKVDTEIPSPAAGTLTKILVGEDETVLVGGDLCIIGGSAAAPAAPEPAPELEPAPEPEPAAAAASPLRPDQAAPQATDAVDQGAPARSVDPSGGAAAQSGEGEPDASSYVTPLVRNLAADHGVDLETLKGTGVGGRIRKQDVLDAAKAAEAAVQPTPVALVPPAAPASAAPSAVPLPASVSPKRGTIEKMSRMRKVIAARMVESLRVSAQLTTVVEVDVTRLSRLRDQHKKAFKEREGVSLSFLPFFAIAAVEALKAYPVVNAMVEGDTIAYHGQENLGIAVDTERGLMVPVIKDAGDLNITGLARKIADLAERTRTSRITPDELGGGTFTLTNTGSRGALFDTPIINQPQVAILCTGAVVKRPMVIEDADGGETIAIRSMCYLALSYDHRIVDGADAARFLVSMKERLEEGNFEL